MVLLVSGKIVKIIIVIDAKRPQITGEQKVYSTWGKGAGLGWELDDTCASH